MARKLSAIHKNYANVEIDDCNKPADFERAIVATGFGKFNLILLTLLIPASGAMVFEQMAVAYITPVAQCDLGLTLENKGLINSMSFAGMISSAFISGYLSDVFGRRKVMIYGYIAVGLCMVLSAFSVNYTMLLIAKFISGFMFTGPISAFATYVSELHSAAYRSKVHLARGGSIAFTAVLVPLLAWGILPQPINIPVSSSFELHSWNIFLMICSLVSFLSALLFSFMPESPKYLMTRGKNDEALEIFAKIYSMNSGRPASDYPIKHLIDEIEGSYDQHGRRKSIKLTAKSILYSMKPLFHMPYLLNLIHVCTSLVLLLVGVFSIKLWYPQLLQAINDYTSSHNGTSASMCIMMNETISLDKLTATTECTVNLNNSSVYINSMILSSIQFVAFLSVGAIVNFFGKKKLASTICLVSGCSAISLYFATSSAVLMTLFPVVLILGEICDNLQITVVLELFPTNVRSMAITLYLTAGRVGIASGNIIFPYLLRAGCLAPFLFCGLAIIGASILISLIPSTDRKALK